jgi:hypothetical protein
VVIFLITFEYFEIAFHWHPAFMVSVVNSGTNLTEDCLHMVNQFSFSAFKVLCLDNLIFFSMISFTDP